MAGSARPQPPAALVIAQDSAKVRQQRSSTLTACSKSCSGAEGDSKDDRKGGPLLEVSGADAASNATHACTLEERTTWQAARLVL